MQDQARHLLEGLFDRHVKDTELFSRLDVDGSGDITWEEFWAGLEDEVRKIVKPDVKGLYESRCVSELTSYQQYLFGHWPAATEEQPEPVIPLEHIVTGIKNWEVLAEIYDTHWSSLALFQRSPSDLVSFNEVWDAIKELTLRIVKDKLRVVIKKEMKEAFDAWKLHFRGVFEKIDTDGSGTIDREEFKAAMADREKLMALPVAESTNCCVYDPSSTDLTTLARSLMEQVFDHQLSDTELFAKIDTDNSGDITWAEFWVYVEKHVANSVKPDVKGVFEARVQFLVSSFHEFLLSYFPVGEADAPPATAVVSQLIAGIDNNSDFHALFQAALSDLPVFSAPERAVQFAEVWDAVQQPLITYVKTSVKNKVKNDMKEAFDYWRTHFRGIFDKIDTDGSGTLDRAEFEAALAERRLQKEKAAATAAAAAAASIAL